jgi:alkanesulfonate monooxygenase SsuD/methylene tetrahydromethanopterin reductase-like flavin-dependent oxidoreductase (luciferase family)
MDTATRLVPDEAVDAFAVGGTPVQCRDRLQAYLDTGIDEPVLSILGGPEERALALSLLREMVG